MPVGLGVVEPVAMTLAVDDWARTVRRWSALIGAKPIVTDFTADGRKRARYASRSLATLDLIEAGIEVAAGDCELVLLVPDLEARLRALRKLKLPVTIERQSEDALLPARYANGVDIRFTRTRPKALGQAMMPLPYVFDLSVRDLKKSAPIWDAILGIEGTMTSIETDSARQFEMRHYVTDGEMHAIGLMRVPPGRFLKRDSLGSSHQFVLDRHGEGALCLGFIFKSDLDHHIATISPEYRDLLLFEEPRSYQMGRNNMSHADQTGGIAVVIAQHFEGWGGDPREARADKDRRRN